MLKGSEILYTINLHIRRTFEYTLELSRNIVIMRGRFGMTRQFKKMFIVFVVLLLFITDEKKIENDKERKMFIVIVVVFVVVYI